MNLYVSEYKGIGKNPGIVGAPIQLPLEPGIEQVIPIGTTSTQSKAFDAETRLITIHTDTACFIAIGVNPKAINLKRMAADETRDFCVVGGHKIAVIVQPK